MSLPDVYDRAWACPGCGNTKYESNGGRLNYTLTFLCTRCKEQTQVCACDGCGRLGVGEDFESPTDRPPFLCARCRGEEETDDVET